MDTGPTGHSRGAARRARLRLALIVAGTACVSAAMAQTDAPQAPVTLKPEITVSATRSARETSEVPATVTVRDRDSLDAALVEDIRDLVRNEPGVTVRRAPARFGLALSPTGRAANEGFNIRGIEGNRVLILVDGLRLPNAFSLGANSFGRGDYLDATAFGAVEILRGPASALYGSDGLAGAVSFLTPDPSDLLARSKADRHIGYRLGYDSSDKGIVNTLSGAVRFGAVEVMLLLTHREASELDNQGEIDAPDSRRTKPNPQDLETEALLSKFVYRLSPDNRLRLTLEGQRQQLFTNALSGVAPPPLAATSVIGLTADDTIRRSRVAIDQRIGKLDYAPADEIRWALYFQEAKNHQLAREDRWTSADRVRDTRYEERTAGGNVEIDKRLAFFTPQRLTYGVDASRTRYTNVRDGVTPPAGETFPAKAFPDTDYTLAGVFAQDEIALAGGRWFVIPALRYDAYRIAPQSSALFPGAPSSVSDSAVSPKLAVQWLPSASWNVYTYVARGFRAPTPDQVNNGFVNPIQNYRSIGNPDLQPETSTTLEVGAKFTAGAARASLAAFSGRYKDFIEQVQVAGNFTAASPAVFQFINLREVEIDGVELGGRWSPWRDWQLSAALAWAEGEDKASGRPLNSVNPLQAVAGVQWQILPALRTRIDVRYAAKKSASDVDSTGITPPATQFIPPASTVLDLTLAWRPRSNVAFNAGVFNLTDRKYWTWTDVRGVATGNAQVDAFTQPGRSFAANLRLDF